MTMDDKLNDAFFNSSSFCFSDNCVYRSLSRCLLRSLVSVCNGFPLDDVMNPLSLLMLSPSKEIQITFSYVGSYAMKMYLQ